MAAEMRLVEKAFHRAKERKLFFFYIYIIIKNVLLNSYI